MKPEVSDLSQDPVRTLIIDAARDLFSRYGYKKTTMEDIAMVLRKGKSSLYYYFKNKEDIFQVVLETEESILFSRLEEVVASDASPKDKLTRYVNVRMHTIAQLDNYVRTLKDELYGGYEFIEQLKRKSEAQESEFIMKILKEGMADGSFQFHNLNMASTSLAIALKGLEAPLFTSSSSPEEFQNSLDNILNLLFYGVIKR